MIEKRNKEKDAKLVKGFNEELANLQDSKHKFELEADKMKEQMMGKYIEAEGRYVGGLDENIAELEKVITGRDEFVKVVAEEIKKL